jgi:hypothetical protein
MIFSRFDDTTLATMDVALESVCKGKVHGENHEFRAFVGKSLLRCAKKGQSTLSAFMEAGEAAAARWVSGDVKKSA